MHFIDANKIFDSHTLISQIKLDNILLRKFAILSLAFTTSEYTFLSIPLVYYTFINIYIFCSAPFSSWIVINKNTVIEFLYLQFL